MVIGQSGARQRRRASQWRNTYLALAARKSRYYGEGGDGEMKDKAEGLIEQCWWLLNQQYEEFYGKHYRGQPQFRLVLSRDDIHILRSHVARLPFSQQVFIGLDKNTMFGHEIKIQRETPFLEGII